MVAAPSLGPAKLGVLQLLVVHRPGLGIQEGDQFAILSGESDTMAGVNSELTKKAAFRLDNLTR